MIELALITAIAARDGVADQFTGPAHPVPHPSLRAPVKRR